MRHKLKPMFEKESDLCAAFIAALDKDWTAYPETCGFDILLVRAADGFQIGVQAKLRLTVQVVLQALEGNGDWRWASNGPDCRAVLVPGGACVAGVAELSQRLALTVIRYSMGYGFRPDLPRPRERWGGDLSEWHELCPAQRLRLPAYVPDTAAGAPAPVQLTEWKIKALRIAVLLERRGYVTRADFKALMIDPRRWIDSGWLVAGPHGLARGTMPDFKAQHPRNYEEIAADFDKWAPKHLAA